MNLDNQKIAFDVELILERNKTLLAHLCQEYKIEIPIEEILMYESVQPNIEKNKNRIRLIGVIKTEVDKEDKKKYVSKRVQLASVNAKEADLLITYDTFDLFRFLHRECKIINELEIAERALKQQYARLVRKIAIDPEDDKLVELFDQLVIQNDNVEIVEDEGKTI